MTTQCMEPCVLSLSNRFIFAYRTIHQKVASLSNNSMVEFPACMAQPDKGVLDALQLGFSRSLVASYIQKKRHPSRDHPDGYSFSVRRIAPVTRLDGGLLNRKDFAGVSFSLAGDYSVRGVCGTKRREFTKLFEERWDPSIQARCRTARSAP